VGNVCVLFMGFDMVQGVQESKKQNCTELVEWLVREAVWSTLWLAHLARLPLLLEGEPLCPLFLKGDTKPLGMYTTSVRMSP
jgi:hypothetical protein